MPAGRIAAAPADNLLLHAFDPLLETAQGFDNRRQALVQRRRDARVSRIGEDRHPLADMSGTIGDEDAKLRHQPAQVLISMGRCLTSISRTPVRARGRLL